MKKLLTIVRWEWKRIFTDWKRTITVFLLPAVLMLVALIVFPVLLNYLTTGSLGRTNIIMVNTPESFNEYYKSIEGRTAYKFLFYSSDEIDEYKNSGEYEEKLKQGAIAFYFSDDFDSKVKNYYEELRITHDESIVSEANLSIEYSDIFNIDTKIIQFNELVTSDYSGSLPSLLDIDTSDIEAQIVSADDFNPIGKLIYNRTLANRGAGRIIPAVMMLLLYYCVYALSMDSFMGDKERGFFTKLKMSPVNIRTIVWGKTIAITAISVSSALLSFFLMLLVSWTNYSNDAASLIPFGMFITPGQFLMLIVYLVTSSLTLTSISALTIFSLEKTSDVTINLQLPLILLLGELFLLFLLDGNSLPLDYLIPVHGTIIGIRDLFRSEETLVSQLVIIFTNLFTLSICSRRLFKKEVLQ